MSQTGICNGLCCSCEPGLREQLGNGQRKVITAAGLLLVFRQPLVLVGAAAAAAHGP